MASANSGYRLKDFATQEAVQMSGRVMAEQHKGPQEEELPSPERGASPNSGQAGEVTRHGDTIWKGRTPQASRHSVIALIDRFLPPPYWNQAYWRHANEPRGAASEKSENDGYAGTGGPKKQTLHRSPGKLEKILGITFILFIFLYIQLSGNPSGSTHRLAAEGGSDVGTFGYETQSEPVWGVGSGKEAAAPSALGFRRALRVGAVAEDGVMHLSDGRKILLLGVQFPTRDRRSENFSRYLRRSKLDRRQMGLVGEQTIGVLARLVEDRLVLLEEDEMIEAEPGAPAHHMGYLWTLDATGSLEKMVNLELLEAGYAEPVGTVRYRYRQAFYEAARSAQSQRQGLWRYDLFELSPQH